MIFQRIERKLDHITTLLRLLIGAEMKNMHTLDELIAAVTEESTQIDSLVTLTAGLKQMLADALADVNLTPEQQAKVDAVFASVADKTAEVVEAINANTV